MKETLNPKSVFNTLKYGFSQAVISGPGIRILLSGQVGADHNEITLSQDLESQAFTAVENIKSILNEAGGELSHIVFLRIYIKEIAKDDQEAIVKMLKTYFPVDPPATSWILVSGLSEPEWLVEIEAEAILPSPSA